MQRQENQYDTWNRMIKFDSKYAAEAPSWFWIIKRCELSDPERYRRVMVETRQTRVTR